MFLSTRFIVHIQCFSVWSVTIACYEQFTPTGSQRWNVNEVSLLQASGIQVSLYIHVPQSQHNDTLIEFELSLCCLMTPGLSKNIWCHVWPCIFCTCKSPDKTSPMPKVSYPLGNCILYMAAKSSSYISRVCIGMYGLTDSLYHLKFEFVSMCNVCVKKCNLFWTVGEIFTKQCK